MQYNGAVIKPYQIMLPDYITLTKEIVLSHIPKNEYKVFVFGSRAVGNHHSKSDIDVGILGSKKLPVQIKLDIEESLEYSNIPFKVEIIDFFEVNETFKKQAFEKILMLN